MDETGCMDNMDTLSFYVIYLNIIMMNVINGMHHGIISSYFKDLNANIIQKKLTIILLET